MATVHRYNTNLGVIAQIGVIYTFIMGKWACEYSCHIHIYNANMGVLVQIATIAVTVVAHLG